jgi:hypothetical protein
MMLTTGGLRPTEMNAFTSSVFDVLEQFVLSPWNVLKAECGWRGDDPLNITNATLTTLLPRVRVHIARMTDDDNAGNADDALRRLLNDNDTDGTPLLRLLRIDGDT